MAVNNAATEAPSTGLRADLGKIARTFLVRDGEKPWTVSEVRAIAFEL